jgi:inorganic pyrophosphatase
MFDVIIEVSKGSNLKYEISKETNLLRLDRVLHTSMFYPGNYGYFPQTLAGDGDPLDVLVLTDYVLQPGIVVECKIIGVLLTEDEKGLDEKILAVPSDKVDKSYVKVNSLDDIPKLTLEKIEHFFTNYKTLEVDKWVKTNGFKNSKFAIDIYNQAKENYFDDVLDTSINNIQSIH